MNTQIKQKKIKFKTKKRAYFVYENDIDSGIGVIATSMNQARMMRLKEFGRFEEYIDIKAHKKSVNVDDLNIGVIEGRTGLIRGIFGWIEDKCDNCNEWKLIHRENIREGKFYCSECSEGFS